MNRRLNLEASFCDKHLMHVGKVTCQFSTYLLTIKFALFEGKRLESSALEKFVRDYLRKGGRHDKHYYFHQIGSRIWALIGVFAFDLETWTILKVNVQ